MFHIPSSPRVAVLIDGDNTQLRFTSQILEVSRRYGPVVICRAYGNWNQFSACHKTLRNLRDLNVELIQQDPVGKNATDHRLMIQALRILDANEADVFIIVSSDSDFAVLCQEIRQNKKQVIGIGSKQITANRLLKACNDFFYVEDL